MKNYGTFERCLRRLGDFGESLRPRGKLWKAGGWRKMGKLWKAWLEVEKLELRKLDKAGKVGEAG